MARGAIVRARRSRRPEVSQLRIPLGRMETSHVDFTAVSNLHLVGEIDPLCEERCAGLIDCPKAYPVGEDHALATLVRRSYPFRLAEVDDRPRVSGRLARRFPTKRSRQPVEKAQWYLRSR